ncbi:MAG: hypothetical protein ACE5F6_02255 [Anaerolineae bacterium]
MAPLTTPHWGAVTVEARDLLTTLGQVSLLRPFYLAGGTALALRPSHAHRLLSSAAACFLSVSDV